MKKNILTVAVGFATLLLSQYEGQAQAEMTAIHLSQAEEYQGSARYQAMGGALGAVGADYSSTRQNPAGVALYRSRPRVAFTLGQNFLGFNPLWQGEQSTKEKSRLLADNLTYITRIGDDGTNWGFSGGLSIHNAGRFYNELDAHTTAKASGNGSLSDYAAIRINQEQSIGNLIPDTYFANSNIYRSGLPWVGILGYKTGWIGTQNPTTGGRYESDFAYTQNGQQVKASPEDAGLKISERGGIREYDFSFGARYRNWLYMGLNLTFSSLDYSISSSYSEGFREHTNLGKVDGLSLDNNWSIKGSGARLGLGLLVEPVEGLRLGASVFTPTVYSLKYDYDALATGSKESEYYKQVTPDGAAGVFQLNTPWRFGLSGAYVFSHLGIISVDYEYSTLGGTRLRADSEDNTKVDSDFDFDNDAIRGDFSDKQTLRLGAEIMATRRLALRAGYRQTSYSSVYDTDQADREALVSGTLVHYSIPRSVQGLSAGIGYRLSQDWSLDLAYSYITNKSRVFAFPAPLDNKDALTTPAVATPRKERLVGFDAINYKQTNHKVALTLSVRL